MDAPRHTSRCVVLMAACVLAGCEGRLVEFVHDPTVGAIAGDDLQDTVFDPFRLNGSVVGVVALSGSGQLHLNLVTFGTPPEGLSVDGVVLRDELGNGLPVRVGATPFVGQESPRPDVVSVGTVQGPAWKQLQESSKATLSVRLRAGTAEKALEFTLRRRVSWSPPSS